MRFDFKTMREFGVSLTFTILLEFNRQLNWQSHNQPITATSVVGTLKSFAIFKASMLILNQYLQIQTSSWSEIERERERKKHSEGERKRERDSGGVQGPATSKAGPGSRV